MPVEVIEACIVGTCECDIDIFPTEEDQAGEETT